MSYPAKTSPDAIRAAALDLLEQGGEGALTVRGVAAALGLAPNALYRHVPGHDALLAAVADDGARALLSALQAAARRAARRGARSSPAAAPDGAESTALVRAVAGAYLAFAAARPALYAVVMAHHESPDDGPPAHEALWAFVVGLFAPLTGAADAPAAAVTLWAFLHGMVGLDRAALLGGPKPRDAAGYGLDAFLAAFAGRGAAEGAAA